MFGFIYGLFVGACAMRLFLLVKEGSIAIPWYGWMLGIVVFLLLSLTLQTFFASFKEREPRAAWLSLLFLGVPTLILAAATAILV